MDTGPDCLSQYYRESAMSTHPFIPPGLRSLSDTVTSGELGVMNIATDLSVTQAATSEVIDPALQDDPQSPMSSRQARTRVSGVGKVGLGESGLDPDVQKAVEAVLSISPGVVANGMNAVSAFIIPSDKTLTSKQPQISPLSSGDAVEPVSAISDGPVVSGASDMCMDPSVSSRRPS